MANSDWFFVFPEVTLGAKKNLEAESVTWLLRLTITYYSSCVQQKQRKDRRKTWNHKKTKHEIKKIPWTSKASSTENCKKNTKTKPSDVTGVANNYSSIQQTKQEKQTNKTHLQQYYTLKTIERRLCLLGFVLIFCMCISEKFNQVSFKCHPWRSSPPLKNKKQKKNFVKLYDVWKKKIKKTKTISLVSSFIVLCLPLKRKEKLFLAIHLFKKK